MSNVLSLFVICIKNWNHAELASLYRCHSTFEWLSTVCHRSHERTNTDTWVCPLCLSWASINDNDARCFI